MRSAVVLIGILSALTSGAALAQSNVDTVVTNGKILTVDADFAVVEALAIDEGRIVARGTSADIARYAGPTRKRSTSRARRSCRASSTTTSTSRAQCSVGTGRCG